MNARAGHTNALSAAARLQHCADRYRAHLALLTESLRSAGLEESHFGPYMRELDLQCGRILAAARTAQAFGAP